MKLSQMKKDILIFINNHEKVTIYDIIQDFCKPTKVIFKPRNPPIPIKSGTKESTREVDLISDIDDLKNVLFELNEIIINETLQRYIVIETNLTNDIHDIEYYMYLREFTISCYKLNQHIWDNLSNKYFRKNDSLPDFIANGFMTEEEMQNILKLNLEIANGKFTRKIAYLSIVVSVVLSCATAVFNFMTYTNIRNVNISSMPSNVQPMKVILVDNTGKPVSIIVQDDDVQKNSKEEKLAK